MEGKIRRPCRSLMTVGIDQQVLGNAHEPALWLFQACARCECQQESQKHFMAEIPGSFSISKMIRKETYDIFVIQGIERLDRVSEGIYQLFHLLYFSVLIDVLPWLISTSNRWSMLFNDFQGGKSSGLTPTLSTGVERKQRVLQGVAPTVHGCAFPGGWECDGDTRSRVLGDSPGCASRAVAIVALVALV